MRLRKRPYRPWYIIGKNGGEVALERQAAGLQLIDFKNKTVLELGSSEGLVSLEMVKLGAKLVHGVELRDRAVEVARSIAHVTDNDERMQFWCGNMSDAPGVFSQTDMLPQYDIVTAMAVLQKIPDQPRVLNCILEKCRHTFVIRALTQKVFQYRIRKTDWSFKGQDIIPLIEKQGFVMRTQSKGYPDYNGPAKSKRENWLAVFDRK